MTDLPGIVSESSLVESLLNPRAYPEPVSRIQLIETHVSFLFLTGTVVYKVKRAVDYGFLDFTTLEKRRDFCRREVELNSRISPQIYYGVVPICETPRGVRFEGEGSPIEFAVKMRQLPAQRALDQMLRAGRLSSQDLDRIAVRIAAFHKSASVGEKVTPWGDLRAVRYNVEENFDQTQEFLGEALSRDLFADVAAYSRAFLKMNGPVFRRREREGRIRDGHGDLHSANIFLENGIDIIDCIEFNDRFRCLDVSEDIAFLAMDLDHLGRPDVSRSFVGAYARHAQDPGVYELLDFFKVYRAYVRGKVAAFRLRDPDLPERERPQVMVEADEYFKLAHRYAQRVLRRPMLIVMCGLMGTGKTSLSTELARRWRLDHLSSDLVRKELAGCEPARSHDVSYGAGIYSRGFTRRTYEELFNRTRESLYSGHGVVLDASFMRREDRQRVIELADETRAHRVIVECCLDETATKERLDRRSRSGCSPSDGRWDLYAQQKKDWEPLNEVPESRFIRLETSASLERTVETLLFELFCRALD